MSFKLNRLWPLAVFQAFNIPDSDQSYIVRVVTSNKLAACFDVQFFIFKSVI
jgi:hypothetical protein